MVKFNFFFLILTHFEKIEDIPLGTILLRSDPLVADILSWRVCKSL